MAKPRIGWRAWDGRAFEEARASKKPLFVLVSAFWCRGGDHSPEASCGDGPLGALIANAFVPVMADADRSPELVVRYGLGEAPACAVLRPDGTLVARLSPGALHENRKTLAALARTATEALPCPSLLGHCRVPCVAVGGASLERGMEGVERIRRRVEAAVESGLSGTEATAALRFMIHYANCTGERPLVERAVGALHVLGLSPLYDAVEGGFFSGDAADGSQTQKLLRANADWLVLALRAAGEPEGAFALPLARGILHYLQHRLFLPMGAFAVGQRPDAAYYRLGSEERRRVAPPAVEPTAYAASNLLAIRAFCKGWRMLGERAYLDLALGAHAFVQEKMVAPDGSLAHRHGSDGPSGLGYLDDLIEQGQALLALYHSTLEAAYLEGARGVARRMVGEYLNPAGGGFLDMRVEDRPPSLPTPPVVDFRLNARAAGFLVLASVQLDEDSLGAVARSVLSVLLAAGEPDLEGACLVGSGLLAALNPMAIYEVITDGSVQQRLRVIEALRGTSAGFSVVTHRLAARGEEMKRLPRLVAHWGHQSREIPLETPLRARGPSGG